MVITSPLSPSATPSPPSTMPMRQRDAVLRQVLEERLDTVLPQAMRAAGLDMWLVLCQEDDLDPVFPTLMPMNAWFPILQMLVFYDRGPEQGVERLSVAMTNTQGLYAQPWSGRRHEEQWPVLAQIVAERRPQRIGIDIGAVQWAAGGLTHNLYTQLRQALPAEYHERLVSAETLVTHWLMTLTPRELTLFDHVVDVAHALLAECYSRKAIVPGVTTTEDLEWHYWQRAADIGLQPSFKPYFNRHRNPQEPSTSPADRQIQPGDLIHSDVGIRYLGLISDHQEWAYVRRPGESEAPEGLRRLMAQVNRLQDVFMASFEAGLTGNALLERILGRARQEGIPNPKVYSHSLGHLLHEPGPLIGLPWEQERCPGRGDVALAQNTCFTMELSATAAIPEWGGAPLTMSMEEDVAFTREGCRPIGGRQVGFYLL